MAVKAPAVAANVRPLDPDAHLVAAAREERRAFLALYDRYFERVLGYVRLRIRDASACEDVTSQVFTNALEQLHRFRGDGSFAGWLFGIARNAVYDAQRRPVSAELPDELPGAGPEVDEQLLARERRQRLRPLVASLDPEQQHLLALRYGADLSFEQIGALLEVPAGTVRVRLHRLLNHLRERYDHDA